MWMGFFSLIPFFSYVINTQVKRQIEVHRMGVSMAGCVIKSCHADPVAVLFPGDYPRVLRILKTGASRQYRTWRKGDPKIQICARHLEDARVALWLQGARWQRLLLFV
jgi:hypothetical protein